MQMEAVVMPPPDRADGIGLFKDRGVEAARPKRRGGGETGGPRANDNSVA